MRSPPDIRPATEEDLPELLEIHNQVVARTTAMWEDEPTTLDERRRWLADHRRAGHPVLVAQLGDQVVGFATYGSFRARVGYAATVEHTVHVREECRGQGIGHRLMARLIEGARTQGVHVMVGAIDGGNPASLAFHAGLGFSEVGRMPEVGRKFGEWRTLILMQLTLD